MSARSIRPPPTIALAALVSGTLLGLVLVAPAVPGLLAALPKMESMGMVGAVLIAGSFGILVFAVGLFVLYFGMLSLEKRL